MAAPSGDDPAGFPECAGLTTIRRSCARPSRRCLGCSLGESRPILRHFNVSRRPRGIPEVAHRAPAVTPCAEIAERLTVTTTRPCQIESPRDVRSLRTCWGDSTVRRVYDERGVSFQLRCHIAVLRTAVMQTVSRDVIRISSQIRVPKLEGVWGWCPGCPGRWGVAEIRVLFCGLK